MNIFSFVSWQIVLPAATPQKWNPQPLITTTTTPWSRRATPPRTTTLAPSCLSSTTSCSCSVFWATGWCCSSSTGKPSKTRNHSWVSSSEEEDFKDFENTWRSWSLVMCRNRQNPIRLELSWSQTGKLQCCSTQKKLTKMKVIYAVITHTLQ